MPKCLIDDRRVNKSCRAWFPFLDCRRQFGCINVGLDLKDRVRYPIIRKLNTLTSCGGHQDGHTLADLLKAVLVHTAADPLAVTRNGTAKCGIMRP